MLKKENRLNSNRAYIATYNNNNIVSDSYIVLYTGKLKQNKDYHSKVGFVVSKKIHKRAVKRNRIKRLMRENIRLMFLQNNETLNKYQSYIFKAKPACVSAKSENIKNSIFTLLEKIAIKNI